MKNITSELDTLKQIVTLIAKMFGDNCEVCLHDWSKGYESCIVAIENGHVTNRKLGDSGSNLGLELIRSQTDAEGYNKYNYVTKTKDGKLMRSSTIYLKNDEGKPIGALCINLDITDYLAMQNTISTLTMVNNEVQEYFVNDVNELLEYFLIDAVKAVGKPVDEMKKEDKMQALKYLDERGALLITKSGERICKYLRISKFTLYNYLDELRRKEEIKPADGHALPTPAKLYDN